MRYLNQFAIIFGMTLAGDLLNRLIPLPIPASVYGLILLFASLASGVLKLPQVERAGEILLEILPLTFLPAGAGVLLLTEQLQTLLLPLIAASTLVTLLVMVISGLVTQSLMRGRKKTESPS
ncbi:MAG: CidA/LrgA family protein [Fretibacterium sp.]|nr:CidA/LrgA family protein [Fretibacterium sp.]